MFSLSKSLLAVVLGATGAFSSFVVDTPENQVHAGAPLTVRWTSSAGDPVFSLELVDVTSVAKKVVLANNVDPSADHITVIIPKSVSTKDAFVLSFVEPAQSNAVLVETAEFTIAPAA
ncbi:hypothetical protein C8F04DRAFT_1111998 [Mycena alexandri]|uniref:Yeast cell wall synthesis Kre9/Knh1-like N-terminal domain-containing protein n=1 Tax=Mycena alexandri TaxID=1745969 RepID=A0AAD6SP07_9AGAR|nr:hypothetical protein C8F04DRAFT_1111998 [Mycena alexandri]